jgi:SprT protein
MDNHTLEVLIKKESAKIFDKYNQIFPNHTLNMKDFEFNFKIKGRVAGKANYSGRKLSFNLILARDNLVTFLNDTVPHEVAHLFQTKMYPDSKPHGQEWRMVMNVGGYEAKRCHNYNTMAIRKAQKNREIFEYNCKCRVHKLSKIKHNRFLRGESYYTCRYCRERLHFVKKWVIPQEGI